MDALLTDDTSINALRPSARAILANHLGNDVDPQDLPTGRRFNNYIGLAELIPLSNNEIRQLQALTCGSSRIETIFELWQDRCRRKGLMRPEVGDLWQKLRSLDRREAMEDVLNILLEDIELYKEDDERHISPDVVPDRDCNRQVCLTTDDANSGCPTYYDAYIAVSDDKKDMDFAKELIDKFEGPENNFKLFLPDRDELPGSAVYDTRAELIETRCRKLIAVITKAFLESESCQFTVRYAQSLNPDARKRKIIPILTEQDTQMPRILRIISTVNLTRCETDLARGWTWERLTSAITPPKADNLDMTRSEQSVATNMENDIVTREFNAYTALPAPDTIGTVALSDVTYNARSEKVVIAERCVSHGNLIPWQPEARAIELSVDENFDSGFAYVQHSTS